MASVQSDPTSRAIGAVESLKPWTRHGELAPHKPLLILLAIARVQGNLPRLADFIEIEAPLRELIRQFGPQRSSYHPEYPFWRLQHDKIWEVVNADKFPPRMSNTDPPITVLRARHAQGGFVIDLYEALRSEPAAAARLADVTVTLHLADVKSQVLAATGASIDPKRT